MARSDDVVHCLVVRSESVHRIQEAQDALVLELCAELGLAAEERAVPLDALSRAEEAFLTSSTREVAPIARVDGRDLPRAPGTVSEQLAAAFGDFIEREVDP